MDKETSWERRGHERKPNAVVRGIYWMNDWFGDFKYLAGSLGRGAGHLSIFAGHSLLLIITLAITACIVITSASHSLELLSWIGFSGGLEYPALFIVEAIFLIGSIQMDIAFKQEKYFPIPPILGFIVGLAFVLASNVMGLADNLGGLLFGIATPFLLIISKAMLAWQYKIRSKSNVEKPSIQVDKIHKSTEAVEEKKLVLESNIIEENLVDIKLEKEDVELILKPDLEVKTDDQIPLDIEEEKLIPDPDLEAHETEDVESEKPDPELKENLDIESDEKQPKTNKLGKTSSGRKTRKAKGSTGNKKPKRTPASNVDYDAIIEVAKRMIEEHPEKKTPTKYKLSKVAKTTEHHAQKALDKMEEKTEVNLIENLNPNLKQNLDIEPDQKPDLERPKLKLAK